MALVKKGDLFNPFDPCSSSARFSLIENKDKENHETAKVRKHEMERASQVESVASILSFSSFRPFVIS